MTMMKRLTTILATAVLAVMALPALAQQSEQTPEKDSLFQKLKCDCFEKIMPSHHPIFHNKKMGIQILPH